MLAALRERRVELNRLAAHLDKDDRRLVVEGELDARPMGYRRGGKPPSYNVQIAVDADTGIVVHHDVTDEVNDLRMLHPMAVATRDLLGRDTLKVVADTGYSNGTPPRHARPTGSSPASRRFGRSTIGATAISSTAPASAMIRSTISTRALLAGPCTGRVQ